jgi:hypothetical protein
MAELTVIKAECRRSPLRQVRGATHPQLPTSARRVRRRGTTVFASGRLRMTDAIPTRAPSTARRGSHHVYDDLYLRRSWPQLRHRRPASGIRSLHCGQRFRVRAGASSHRGTPTSAATVAQVRLSDRSVSRTSLNAEIANHTASAPRSTAAIRISKRSFAEASRLSTGVRERSEGGAESLSGLFANRPDVITQAAAPLQNHRVALHNVFERDRVVAMALRALRRNLQRQAIRHRPDLNPSVAPNTIPPRWVLEATGVLCFGVRR